MKWTDTSNEDMGEQYQHHIPSVILADLWHYDYEDLGERRQGWSLSLAKLGDGKLVTERGNFRASASADEAKAWAEKAIASFMAGQPIEGVPDDQ